MCSATRLQSIATRLGKSISTTRISSATRVDIAATRLESPVATRLGKTITTGIENFGRDFCNENSKQYRMNLEKQRHGFFSEGFHLGGHRGKTKK